MTIKLKEVLGDAESLFTKEEWEQIFLHAIHSEDENFKEESE